MRKKISSHQIVNFVRDGDTVTGTGFSFTTPEELFIALEDSFLRSGHPRDLTILIPGGAGNMNGGGFDHFAHEGFIKRVIGPYFNLTPKLQQMILQNIVEAYMLPAGVLAQLLRDIGGNRPGLITHVGLNSFMDPRMDGGRMNSISKDTYSEIINIDKKDWIRYKPINIDVALLKVTTADEFGNSTMEKEAGYLTTLPMAIATHNCGGKVILQVERVAGMGTLNPKHVIVPGILVDAVVVAKPENHWMTWKEQYNPSRSGELKVPDVGLKTAALTSEKIIGRRAIYEISPGEVVNLGAGIPEYVTSVAWEEKIFDKIVLTIEAGMIGGIPGNGLQFNTASNAHAIIDQTFQMDLYDGGGNNVSCVGFAQIDKSGNVNVSKLNSRIPGVGGFLNVFPRARKKMHCGAFTAGKSNIVIENGKMSIKEDGPITKFVDSVEQVTLNGKYINHSDRPTLIITERAVFEYSYEGFVLTEIAPGVDVRSDILDKMEFSPRISCDLCEMPSEIFQQSNLRLCEKEPWNSFNLY